VLEGPVASILQFARADGSVFDDSVTSAMGAAFDAACAELHDNNLPKLACEIIAGRIIEAARRGERDTQRLCSIGIAAMNASENSHKGPASVKRVRSP
jgi:hypothetical protein